MKTKTDLVKDFYSKYSYPNYGEQVKTAVADTYKNYCVQQGKWLEAGCGTGHSITGTALSLPHLEFYGIDLSGPSLDIAREVTKANKVKVNLQLHNLMTPLTFDFKFKYISCSGVIHHVETPKIALRNLVDKLQDDGFIFIHAYGEDYHRRRFQIIEMLDLISSSTEDMEKRFNYFNSYVQHVRKSERKGVLHSIYRMSIRSVFINLLDWWRYQKTRYMSEKRTVHTWHAEMHNPLFTPRWTDQFANPSDRSYNLIQFNELFEESGLEVVEYLSLGKFRSEHLPANWENSYEKLDIKDQARLMELLNPNPTSPSVVLRKKGTKTVI